MLKLDYITLQASRGKFARVCIELDLTKPLKAENMLKGKLRRVQYEGLHSIYFHCGRYGHKVLDCPLLITKESNSKQQQRGSDLVTAPAKVNSATTSNATERDEILNQDAHKTFGPWTIARRHRRQQPTHINTGDSKRMAKNRLHLLEDSDEDLYSEKFPNDGVLVKACERKTSGKPLTGILGSISKKVGPATPARLTSAEKTKAVDESRCPSRARMGVASANFPLTRQLAVEGSRSTMMAVDEEKSRAKAMAVDDSGRPSKKDDGG